MSWRTACIVGALVASAGLAGMGAGRGPTTASRAATKPATKPASNPPANAENSGALYQKIVADYLGGEWGALEEDFNGHAADLAAMNKEQKDDVAYIKQALIDGRGAIDGTGWWDMIKAGKTASTKPAGNVGGAAAAVTAGRGAVFRMALWGHNLSFAFDTTLQSSVQMSTLGNSVIFTLNWPVGDMDSKEQAEHGFTKGDLGNLGVWQVMAQADVFQSFTPEKLKSFTPEETEKLAMYMAFRGNLTGAYYGTPRARRWAIFLSLDAFMAKNADAGNFIPRKPLGAMIVQELVAHHEKYPSVKLPGSLREANAETTLASGLMGVFEKTTLTLAEDKALRAAIKDFATPNQGSVFSTGKVTLPNKLTIMFDPKTDGEAAGKRNAWLAEQVKP